MQDMHYYYKCQLDDIHKAIKENELEKASAKLDLLLNKIEQDINYKIDMLQQEIANVSRIIKMKEHIYTQCLKTILNSLFLFAKSERNIAKRPRER